MQNVMGIKMATVHFHRLAALSRVASLKEISTYQRGDVGVEFTYQQTHARTRTVCPKRP